MNKITFKDLPSTETPINAENLNLMQDNIESAVNENAEKIESHHIPISIQNDQAWYLALSGNIVGHNNNAFVLSIQQVNNGHAGQLYANIRCYDTNSLDLIEFKWLSNTGLNSSDFKLVLDGNNYYLYMKTPVNYGQYQIKVVQATSLQEKNEKILTFYTPDASESVEEPGGINPLEVIKYSTEEQVVGTWIDGKPVYRKVIDTIISVTTLATWTNIGTLGGVAEKVLKITKTFDGCDEKVGAGYIVPTAIQVTQDHVDLAVFNETLQSVPMVVIIEYTKTTD